MKVFCVVLKTKGQRIEDLSSIAAAIHHKLTKWLWNSSKWKSSLLNIFGRLNQTIPKMISVNYYCLCCRINKSLAITLKYTHHFVSLGISVIHHHYLLALVKLLIWQLIIQLQILLSHSCRNTNTYMHVHAYRWIHIHKQIFVVMHMYNHADISMHAEINTACFFSPPDRYVAVCICVFT